MTGPGGVSGFCGFQNLIGSWSLGLDKGLIAGPRVKGSLWGGLAHTTHQLWLIPPHCVGLRLSFCDFYFSFSLFGEHNDAT